VSTRSYQEIFRCRKTSGDHRSFCWEVRANGLAMRSMERSRGTALEAGVFKGPHARRRRIAPRHQPTPPFCCSGLRIDGRHRNRGIATRACGALLAHAFATLDLYRIQICADAANLPSQRVARKLGFTREGVCARTTDS
jgi:GNAT superfamily N-acetyltransferase